MNAHDPKTHGLSQGLTGPGAATPAAASAAGGDGVSSKLPQTHQKSAAQGSASNATPPRGPRAVVDPRDMKKFRNARQYSRRVRGLKLGLPIIGGLLILLFVSLATITQFIKTPFGVAAIDLTDGKVVMDNPTLSGFTASDAAYEIVADRALQDLDNPKRVLLEVISATLTLNDGNIVSVDANTGDFDIEGENLKLGSGVNVHMSAGYKAELDSAVIDIKNGVLTSTSPVFIESEIGDIRADDLTVRDNGNYIFFENRVRVVIQPEKIRHSETTE